jgi:hypothetical protein
MFSENQVDVRLIPQVSRPGADILCAKSGREIVCAFEVRVRAKKGSHPSAGSGFATQPSLATAREGNVLRDSLLPLS